MASGHLADWKSLTLPLWSGPNLYPPARRTVQSNACHETALEIDARFEKEHP